MTELVRELAAKKSHNHLVNIRKSNAVKKSQADAISLKNQIIKGMAAARARKHKPPHFPPKPNLSRASPSFSPRAAFSSPSATRASFFDGEIAISFYSKCQYSDSDVLGHSESTYDAPREPGFLLRSRYRRLTLLLRTPDLLRVLALFIRLVQCLKCSQTL